MFYFRVFGLLRCFIIGFANTRTDYRTEIECFIIGYTPYQQTQTKCKEGARYVIFVLLPKITKHLVGINRLICRFVGSLFFIFRFKSFCILMQFEFCDISIQLSALRNLKFQTNDILVKNPSCSDEAQHRSDRVRKVFIT